jgi:hypothetical protein
MKFWGTFSRNIFKLFARSYLRKFRTNSIEIVLSRSVRMLDPQSVAEIKEYVKGQCAVEGGFADRGGKPDLYYSLFGCYIAEALGMDEVKPLLKVYLKKVLINQKLKGVHLKCARILYAKLFGTETLPAVLKEYDNISGQYSDFINLLADYYSEDYSSFLSVTRRLRQTVINSDLPCSVVSAKMILEDIFGKKGSEPWSQVKGFYKNGSFQAFRNTFQGDMLSTGVALYALRFVNSDMSLIKPDCLAFIDLLYSDGGFCATVSDPVPDVEYTFYGLLALGSLSD